MGRLQPLDIPKQLVGELRKDIFICRLDDWEWPEDQDAWFKLGKSQFITMPQPLYLFVGGLVAMGFDATGKYLLTISYSGRGVFSSETWQRVARDDTFAYPNNGKAAGIGSIQGQMILVEERNEKRELIEIRSPDGKFLLLGEANGIFVK